MVVPEADASGPPVPLLAVESLAVEFRTRSGVVHALEDVSFSVNKGETIGVVGESGSGKSVLFYAVLGILDAAGRISRGRAVFGGLDLTQATAAELEAIRGREAAMIFQNPRVALNPIRKVGHQIEDVLARHTSTPSAQLKKRALEALTAVRIPDPERRYHAYPFELSGGLCQRIMIAIALACTPSLLVADEPTTGLDVTTQAAVMDLIGELARRRNMATVLITHDLGLAAEYCDRIVVMHAGHVVETASTTELFAHPRHPYTAKLIATTPHGTNDLRSLAAIPGNLPDLRRSDLPPCRFSERCDRVEPVCQTSPLARQAFSAGHTVACCRPI
ncbi:MAG: ABC transporter ATP-binding protein [Proteobacteria bacterium]|nr:ABC transporter ATP-binding protein [Burkholderiales bacterium]